MLNANKISLFLLIALFNSYLYAEPTKVEVISFINKKFQQYGYVFWAKNYSQTKIELKCQKDGVCFIKDHLNQNGSIEDRTYKFNLKNIDINKINFQQHDDNRSICYLRLYCKDTTEKCVTLIDFHINGSREYFEIDAKQPGVYFYIKYKSQAIKIKKAFIYLIKKYSNKDELF